MPLIAPGSRRRYRAPLQQRMADYALNKERTTTDLSRRRGMNARPNTAIDLFPGVDQILGIEHALQRN